MSWLTVRDTSSIQISDLGVAFLAAGAGAALLAYCPGP